MNKVENYTKYIEDIADDNSHGYSQFHRNGDPDFDCSSLVIEAVDRVIPVKKYGATYTANMYRAFLLAGFKDVTKSINLINGSGLKRGDILLKSASHTEVYIGNGRICGAKSSETGGKDGKAGDQTGREICRSNYYNFKNNWDYVLRYPEDNIDEKKVGDFIERLYQTTLNRSSDPAGKQYWIDRAKNGASGSELANGFLYSPEFKNNSSTMSHTSYVELLYGAFFGRHSDPVGLKHWTDLLYSGATRESIIEGFVGSQEWRDLCHKAGIEPR